MLYDITSSYFEGAYTQSDLVTFGQNRDGKRGHEQMVIALLCSAEGRPAGVSFRPVTRRTLPRCLTIAVATPDGLKKLSLSVTEA